MTKRAAEQGSELVRRLLAFARRQKLEPHPIDAAVLAGRGLRPARPHARRAGRDRMASRRRRVARLCRPGAARARAGQPDHQRPRRDARGRNGHDLRRKSRRRAPTNCRRSAAGDYVRARGRRHRHRHRARRSREGDGAVLHDQGGRQGQRARPQHGLRLRQAVGRRVPDRQRARSRHDGRAVAAPRARTCERTARSRGTDAQGEPRCATLTVLLVDDHAEVRSTTAAVLEDLGHKVVEAANGAEALQVARRRAIATTTC